MLAMLVSSTLVLGLTYLCRLLSNHSITLSLDEPLFLSVTSVTHRSESLARDATEEDVPFKELSRSLQHSARQSNCGDELLLLLRWLVLPNSPQPTSVQV